MSTTQRIISAVMAIIIVVAAIISHYYGVPDGMILLVAGVMLSNLLLQVFWVKKSMVRAKVLMIASSLGGLVLLWYLFKVPLLLLIPGGIFLFVIMYVNSRWLKNSTAKAREQLVKWATANGGQLLTCEQRFETGPFGGWQGRGQLYFEFVICDRQGKRHPGWAHFDYSLLGSGRYEIKWMENMAQSVPAGST